MGAQIAPGPEMPATHLDQVVYVLEHEERDGERSPRRKESQQRDRAAHVQAEERHSSTRPEYL